MYFGETDEDYASIYSGGVSGYDDNADEAHSAYYSGGLGADITSAVSLVSGLFSKSKDPGRLASNTEAYNLAVSGGNPPYKSQPSALEFLRVMSTSWATTVAKNDAAKKYAQAMQILNQRQAVTTPSVNVAPMGGPVVAGMSSGPLVIAGVAALGLYMLTKKGRR